MKIGLFSPNYSRGECSLSSLFIDGIAHGLRALDVEVQFFSGDSSSGVHWYGLAEEYKNLNALLVPLDNGAELAVSRHVARLYPGLPIMLTGNYFEGTYDELRELSTAKILRDKFLKENSSRQDLVISLADSFERNWGADVYQRVLQIRDDVLPKGQRLYFSPIKSDSSSAESIELAFPIVRSGEKSRGKSDKPFVIVDGGLEHGFYDNTVCELAADSGFDVLRVSRDIQSADELFTKCGAAELVFSLSPLPGYSAAAVAALSLGTSLAAPFTSSYADILVDELKLSPGFAFRESVQRLFAGSNKSSAAQQALVTEFFDSKVVAKRILEGVKDHSFFLAGKAAQFDKQMAETKLAMLGDPIE